MTTNTLDHASPEPPLPRAGSPGRTARLGDFTTDRRVLLLMLLAVAAGTLSVGAAWLLLKLIALCTNLAYFGRLSVVPLPIAATPLGWAAVFVPVLGCLVIGLMARYGSEKIRGHGIPEAIEAILIGKSRISPKVAVLKPLSSAISIGTGGPFGAEGPIIMTGGALGSLLAQTIHLTASERKALLVAGAAAGMTAIFGTPVAAVLLAVELLLFEWKPRSFLPVLVAAAVAAAERTLLFDAGPLFPYAGGMALSGQAMLAWALVGLSAGLASGLLTAMVYACEDAFQALPIHWMWWPLAGGLAIGIGGLIDPAALGVGYDNIAHLLAGDMPARAVLLLLVVKAVIWAIALGSGTSGGVLAPLLIFGGCLGALESLGLPAADAGFWALLGMAAMMGGTMRAPLTATLFAVELTGNLAALLPLLTACGIAYATTVLLLKRSILTEKIARRGHHITREYHADPFTLVPVGEVMVREVDVLGAEITVGDAVAFFTAAEHRHKSYPVVDAGRQVVGMVSRADILAWTVDDRMEGLPLGEALEGRDLLVGTPQELVGHLADRMAAADVGRVPILDRQTGRLVGLVARKDLLQVRARTAAEEKERAVYLGLGARGR
ncbi:chloride channel protein [Labrys wisconsinensis]|uniref:H+/Cl- antiporter ClcA/CBS domain-containing protein n=1 Tax=Labrys wisconsinensis TaxID=425677 RepID=A0ABU0JAS0_9HYPH|nr:chloride channel protein [Labrys wisconsinensis]MDQ0470282.1 H+/Cl- antiporter ClcA/CBS domain-containing protein [Labrys wisconsinensis]